MMKEILESGPVFTRRQILLLAIATVLLLGAMTLMTERSAAGLLTSFVAGVACYLWWGVAAWLLGDVVGICHVISRRIYDVAANVLPTVFALTFMYNKMDTFMTTQEGRWGAFWTGVTCMSIVSAGAALWGRAFNSTI